MADDPRHQESQSMPGRCRSCLETWPCQVRALLADLAAANATIEAERAAHRATEQERIDEAVNATVAEHDLQEARATVAAQALVIEQYRDALLTKSGLACNVCHATWVAGEEFPNGHYPDCILATPQSAAVEQAAAVLKAGEAMAESIAELLSGGIEMKPVAEGPVTFEAMLMLIQMLGVHRDAYRRARLALSLAGSGEG